MQFISALFSIYIVDSELKFNTNNVCEKNIFQWEKLTGVSNVCERIHSFKENHPGNPIWTKQSFYVKSYYTLDMF